MLKGANFVNTVCSWICRDAQMNKAMFLKQHKDVYSFGRNHPMNFVHSILILYCMDYGISSHKNFYQTLKYNILSLETENVNHNYVNKQLHNNI